MRSWASRLLTLKLRCLCRKVTTGLHAIAGHALKREETAWKCGATRIAFIDMKPASRRRLPAEATKEIENAH